MYAFKNCWGLKNAPCKQGVVQDLNRMNYLGYVSHIRRINTPLSSSSKIRAPHSLHASSYGTICPSETPDGANIGVRKNLALLGMITFNVNSLPLVKVLYNNNMQPIFNINNDNINCKIFLNERLIGFHLNPKKFIKKLKLLRRNALINIYTSIAWYCIENIIKISTDSGRATRPLLIVENNKLLLNGNHIDYIKKKNITWKHLIGGFRTTENFTININAYNEFCEKCISIEDDSLNFLEDNSGVIEYIDTEEANTCLIAMTPYELNHNINKFTHCEIHPSMMFGLHLYMYNTKKDRFNYGHIL